MPLVLGDHLLGRRVDHDERSRAFPAPTATAKVVSWRHYGGVLDQGDVGSCTANALEQWRMTAPGFAKGLRVTEADALALYHAETILQGGPVYPPGDPGGSGLAVCKAARQAGLIKSFTHAFGLEHAIGAIAKGPFLVGTDWYDEMFTPDAGHHVHLGGRVVGGHEYVCTGYDQRGAGRWRFLNSWGASWGMSGAFYMDTATFDQLLRQDGDVTVPSLV